MSIIDELLVFLDDQNEIELDEIKDKLSKKSKQTVSSALGRLSAKGWVKHQTNKKNMKLYKITVLGKEEINKKLKKIREVEDNQWDGSWVMVTFSIPEKMRKSRDAFRNSLVELGFMRFFNDLWLSFWDKRKDVESIIKELKIEDYSTFIRIQKLSSENEKKFITHIKWDETGVNSNYKEFITEVDKFLKNKKDAFHARLLVYKYAKALSMDPQFPKNIQPDKYLGELAYKAYLKIRPYCYK